MLDPRVASLPDQGWIDDVGAVDGLEMVPWDLSGPPPRSDIGLVVPPYMGDISLLRNAVGLHLDVVQLLTAGYDDAVRHLPSGAALANAAGVHDASTAELAVGLTIAALRDIPGFVRAQQRGEWVDERPYDALADRRVMVLGYGSVGRAVVQRLLPFEVAVTAVASRGRAGDDLVERVHGIDELPQLLSDQDVVIVVVPLTDQTRALVDLAFLQRLPDDCLVVNIARGPVADTGAILREAGRLRFALDVTDPEPLPPDHPLWRAPRVLISPHTGGATTAFRPRAVGLVRAQLRRYAAGEPLENLVQL